MSTQVLIGASFSSVQSCYLGFDAIGKQFLLLNDAGNAWLSGVAPGGGSIGNSQCTVLGSGSSVALSGNQLTLTYNVQFQPWIFRHEGNLDECLLAKFRLGIDIPILVEWDQPHLYGI